MRVPVAGSGHDSSLLSFLCLDLLSESLLNPLLQRVGVSAPFNFCNLGMMNFSKIQV